MSDLTFWAQNRANWERPGALVRDPETGAEWRKAASFESFAGKTNRWTPDNDEAWEVNSVSESKNRAIAAGPVVDDPGTRGILLDWLVRVWCKDGRSLTIGHGEHVSFVHLARMDGWLMTHRHVHESIHWALTSPDSPVREV